MNRGPEFLVSGLQCYDQHQRISSVFRLCLPYGVPLGATLTLGLHVSYGSVFLVSEAAGNCGSLPSRFTPGRPEIIRSKSILPCCPSPRRPRFSGFPPGVARLIPLAPLSFPLPRSSSILSGLLYRVLCGLGP